MSLPEIFERIRSEVDLSNQSNEDLCRELFSEDYNYDITDELDEVLKKYDHQIMEGDFGGEGEGEYCYSVIRLDGKFYRAEWSYYSYNGCDFGGIERTVKEVTPREKLITVYE